MISRKTKYGLQALIYLAKHYKEGPILIADLAGSERIPKKFLELILLELKNKGILESKRGKGGGYALGKSAKEITMGEVIRILEGPLAPVSCVSQSAYHRCKECRDELTCGIRLVMKDVREAMAGILDNTSLADVLKKVERVSTKDILNFII